MKNDYIVKNVYRSFLVISILTSLTATVGVLIDNIIVGHFLGDTALGAMGVVNSVSLLLSAFGNVCSGGGTARAAQAIGRGDREQVCRIFTVTMLLAAASGIVITILGLLFTPQIAIALGAHGELEQPAIDYLTGYFPGAAPTILMTALMGFVRVDGSKNLPLICICVMTVVNITMDLVMVVILDQGMFGMALATSISYCCAALAGGLHFRKKTNTLKLVKPTSGAKELRAVIVTGLPTSISRICDTIKVAALNNMMVMTVGAAAVTALSVRTQAYGFLGALTIGIGTAAIPVAGMFFGEEDRTALKAVLKTSLRYGLIINGVVTVVLFVHPAYFSDLLCVADPVTMEMSNEALRYFALGIPIALVNTVLMNFYQSTKKTGFATAICVMQGLIYTVLFAAILIRPVGSTGVWIAFLLGEVFTLISIIVVVTCKNRRFSIKLADYMLLATDFDAADDRKLEVSIGNSMDEVMKLSRDIHRFGQDRGAESRIPEHVSLFIEEMAGNVVKHAFKPGEKKWLDLMILDKGDAVVIRMRDNGAAFDPLKYAENRVARQELPVLKGSMPTSEQADTDAGFGIHLVTSLSDRLEYRRSLGLNVVIIELRKES